MKRKSIVKTLLVGVLAFTLVGCGKKSSSDEKIIKIGVSPVPHKEIVEHIAPELEKEGYKLKVVEFTDYVTPNTALAEGEIDANYFQHTSYLNETNDSKGLDLTYTAEIHLEPIALYSKTVKDLNELKDGATIAIPNDPSNEARALRLLEKQGLITLKDGELITPKDVTENKKNLKFKELEAAQLPRVLDEVDAAIINGNYAIEADLNPLKDALVIEDKDAKAAKIYRNILAVKKGNENSDKIKALTKALTSDSSRKFIEEKYNGAVIPTF
ncbi:MetQ/NlpA family ABC transporter substrate-binding protein [Clostridium chauvoei]|uniref:Lipoprotein n=2 Tax=Clostridium chauvoei TaxID=46867 RepID=S6FBH2_9CLOT|nr:MetQ/NlpA family ABC transporter substrate-binding protein [Clostridium chauvoei]ATD55692.1 methionine ABC transporter substrate-binding protein [Clostridium chauvoei]ATD56631.1 methionine ABC transporter substrate-binding protein [Clostridium chauvoei]MBX7280065.1 MetQ/NlpA family ABC transporter substrate-binding protein [Clostridium chauvoei]MBX7282549.1 MetQ/NlpA family ABC transporter substrate-binding protein [Clostridium chauvoei]MBX7284956.1 MetQ/NlpA family ABC transporter substrat